MNGLLLEYLEDIPEPGTAVKVGEYPIEILQTEDRKIKVVRLLGLKSSSAGFGG